MQKAKHHAQKAIEACDCGDHKMAAHHFGHALASLRGAKEGSEAMKPAPIPSGTPSLGALRKRLGGMKKPKTF